MIRGLIARKLRLSEVTAVEGRAGASNYRRPSSRHQPVQALVAQGRIQVAASSTVVARGRHRPDRSPSTRRTVIRRTRRRRTADGSCSRRRRSTCSSPSSVSPSAVPLRRQARSTLGESGKGAVEARPLVATARGGRDFSDRLQSTTYQSARVLDPGQVRAHRGDQPDSRVNDDPASEEVFWTGDIQARRGLHDKIDGGLRYAGGAGSHFLQVDLKLQLGSRLASIMVPMGLIFSDEVRDARVRRRRAHADVPASVRS